MTVMTDPVTTGGKKRSSRLKTPRRRKPIDPGDQEGAEDGLQAGGAAARARADGEHEATAANEVPCTIGSRAPIQPHAEGLQQRREAGHEQARP